MDGASHDDVLYGYVGDAYDDHDDALCDGADDDALCDGADDALRDVAQQRIQHVDDAYDDHDAYDARDVNDGVRGDDVHDEDDAYDDLVE